MSDLLDGVLADLAAESERLDALVAPLPEEGWRTPTPAAGWDVATQVAHLAWTDEVAVAAATDKQAWDAYVMDAIGDPEGFVEELVDFGISHAARTRKDHALFVEAFREGRFDLVKAVS